MQTKTMMTYYFIPTITEKIIILMAVYVGEDAWKQERVHLSGGKNLGLCSKVEGAPALRCSCLVSMQTHVRYTKIHYYY